MRLNKIVAGKVERNCRLEVFQLLTESERQPIKPLDVQASRSIQPLDVARWNVLRIRLAYDPDFLAGSNARRAVLTLWSAVRTVLRAVGFYNLRIVNFPTENDLNRILVSVHRVRGNLNAIVETWRQVLNERNSVRHIALAGNTIGRNQLCLCVNRAIRPNITKSRIVKLRDVTDFFANKSPNFVKLKTVAIEAAHLLV